MVDFFYTTMNKKVKIVQWDEQGMKQFKSFLKQMYGEYGKVNISCDRKIILSCDRKIKS